MVNVDVTHWFRDAPSDSRLDMLCRLLECCVPLELRYLATFLDELLRGNVVLNPPTDCTTYTNLKHLREITDSNCRRQLCVLLTRLKSANKIPAYNIYDILIRYDFTEFFSRVITMEEELVDEILLLFTLAANHPAMTFSQRNRLHQRLVDLRETIKDSFKCCQIDANCSDDMREEYLCCPLESEDATSTVAEAPSSTTLPSTTLHCEPTTPKSSANDEAGKKKFVEVHIKDLRILKVQQRPYDKKYEYVFEVTWSNGKVIKIHRAYGELFDFQCKLRRRNSKEGSKVTGRRIIPYLPLSSHLSDLNIEGMHEPCPRGTHLILNSKHEKRLNFPVARRPIKFCKANDVLPDISDYVREFAQLPDRLLHSEWVENFFSDGNEKDVDESTQKTPKSKQNCGQDKKECVAIKQTETSHVNGDIKTEKGHGVLRKHSPTAKPHTTVSCKKSTISPQTCGKLESKKRNIISSKTTHIEPSTPIRNGNDANTINHPPDVHLISPTSPSPPSNTSPVHKTQTVSRENKENNTVTNENQVVTKTLVSMTTNSAEKNCRTGNDAPGDADSETIVKDVVEELVKMSIAPQTPLTVAVPFSAPVCSTCATFHLQSSSEGSLTSSLSTSPLGSPATSFVLSSSSRSPSLPSSPDQHHFDFVLATETSNAMKLLKLCQLQKYENLFRDFTDEQVLGLCDSDIEQLDMAKTDKQTLKSSICRLKSSSHGFLKNGYSLNENNIHPSLAQNGLLIVSNGFTQYPVGQTEHFTTSSTNDTVACCEAVKTKLSDKNCNYISQNGEHTRNLDVNSNTTCRCKQQAHLNDQSNGFYKPYCFNCGGYGHVGHYCLETQMERPSVS